MPLSKVHTFTAEKYLTSQGITNKAERNLFLLGTNFPDIRDILPLSRDLTHPKIRSINNLREIKSSFMQGVAFHSLIDNIWSHYIDARGGINMSPEELLAIKTIQEKFTPLTSVPQLTDSSIQEIQDTFNIDRQMILKWYRIITISLRSNYDLNSTLKMLEFFPRRNRDGVKSFYIKHENNPFIKEIHRGFLQEVNLMTIRAKG